jgi:uncharacterized protein YggE
MSNSASRLLALVALAGALAWLPFLPAGPAAAADPDKTERTVTVSARGTVIVAPDIAHITTGVVTEAGTAKEAIARNSAAMAKLFDGLKGAGISPDDMQTTQLNVEPRYTQGKAGHAAAISGYRMSNLVRLTVRDVKRLGEMADLVISLGANQIGQITFAFSDVEWLTDEARRNAMKNARRRAELYAKAAGADLGPVLRISEDLPDLGAGATAFTFRKSAPPPIEAGTRRLVVEVSVVYALR